MAKRLVCLCLSAAISCVLIAAGCSNFRDSGGSQDSAALVDTDNDGIPNINDTDIDGDGVLNEQDNDMDDDGIVNEQDSDIDGDEIANIDDNDIDGDGIPNNKDGDIDGDGIANGQDSDIDGDGIPNGNDIDIDGDGIVNSLDDDMDGDGTPNASDPVPDGTGDGSSGTQGEYNTGADENSGENDDTVNSSGLAVQASDAFSVSFTFHSAAAGTSTTEVELVELQDIRDEVADNGIDLPSAYVKDISVSVSPQSQQFVADNADVRCIIKVYYQQVGQPSTRTLIAQTPENSEIFPMVMFGDLNSGVSLNDGLYVVMPGYAEYMNIIKDETQTRVEMVIEVINVDALSSTGTVEINVETVMAGKKAL